MPDKIMQNHYRLTFTKDNEGYIQRCLETGRTPDRADAFEIDQSVALTRMFSQLEMSMFNMESSKIVESDFDSMCAKLKSDLIAKGFIQKIY